MRTLSKYLLAIIAMATFFIPATAQVENHRGKGYKGSVSVTNRLGVFVGAETSHGYMFDAHNYLGAGLGGFVLPNDAHPTFLTLFVDYQRYFLNKKNAPVLGVKAGFSHAGNYEETHGIQFNNSVLLEPNAGWSWGLKSGNALTLGLGATLMMPVGEARTGQRVLALPKLSFGFEF